MSKVLRQGIVAAGESGNPDLNDLTIGATAIRFWWHSNQDNNSPNSLIVDQDGVGLGSEIGDYVGSISPGSSGAYTYRLRDHLGAGAQELKRHAQGLDVGGSGASFISSIGPVYPQDAEKLPGSVSVYPYLTGIAAGMRFKYEAGFGNTGFSAGGVTFFAQDDSPASFCFQGVPTVKKLGIVANNGSSYETPTLSMNMESWNNVIALLLPSSPTEVEARIYLNGRLVGSSILLGDGAITRHTFGAGGTFNADLLIQSTFFIEGNFLNNVADLNAYLTYGIPA